MQVMSAARPAAPLVAVSSDPAVATFGCLLWGVVPMTATDDELRNPNALAIRLAGDLGLAKIAQAILIVRGFHGDPALNAPSVSVVTMPA